MTMIILDFSVQLKLAIRSW